MVKTNNRDEFLKLAGWIRPRTSAYLIGLTGSSLIDSGVPLLMPLLVKFILDAVVAGSLDRIWTVSVWFLAVIVFFCVLTPFMSYLFNRAVKRIMADLRLRVFRHLGRLPMAYYEQTHSGDSLSRVNQDLILTENVYAGNMRALLVLLMSGGYSAAAMFALDWRFAAVLIGVGFATTYVNTRFAKPLRKLSAAIQQGAGRQLEQLSDMLAGTQVSRMFQMQRWLHVGYQETNQQLTRLTISRSARLASLNSTNYLLMWIQNSGAFIAGTLMLISGQLTLGTLLALVLLLEQVTNTFRNLGNVWASMQASLAGASRVLELLDQPEEPASYTPRPNDDDQPITNANKAAQGSVEFRNVAFAYEQGKEVLTGIRFAVEQGQFAALVGPSGGGKSTILKLLLGFYPPDRGDILIDGCDSSELSLEERRSRIAYVSQEADLFDGTIEDNIRFGRPEASMDEVIAAARAANAHEFIMQLPDRYAEKIGERGARLSGGQKQRIMIARAFLKDAPLLLLDEATSALDSESEQAVQESLRRLMQGRMTIAVAHRLSTVRHADVIYVFDQGRIAEQGTHEELLRLEGLYSRYCSDGAVMAG